MARIRTNRRKSSRRLHPRLARRRFWENNLDCMMLMIFIVAFTAIFGALVYAHWHYELGVI